MISAVRPAKSFDAEDFTSIIFVLWLLVFAFIDIKLLPEHEIFKHQILFRLE